MIDLAAAPFSLGQDDLRWVDRTMDEMTALEKVGQLFCEILWDRPGAEPDDLFRVIQPGAVMHRPAAGRTMRANSARLQQLARIPLLIACNLERGGRGGNGGLTDGTYVASPMGVAATADPIHAYRTGLVAAREGAAAGVNWTFEPIIDIDLNPDNPITNVRTYGSDVDTIIAMAKGYIDGCRELGMATTLKHFPGDGVDYRDQHLLTSINSLSGEDWDASYGRIYRALIEYGAPAVMSAHIMQPALARLARPGIRDEDILPTSLSAELNRGVLRERLGFNGLIVSDATQMAGFTAAMPRRRAVPLTIANGVDMFLFTINHEEDVGYMLDGLSDGTISPERLDSAVRRVLALKASIGLHRKQAQGALVPPEEALTILQADEHLMWAAQCADRAVTMVKDRDSLLPITPTRFARIELVVVTNGDHGSSVIEEPDLFRRLLEQAGFQVRYSNQVDHPGETRSIADYRNDVDLVVYFANMQVSSNQTTIRVQWEDFLGGGAPKYARDIPTVFVSFSNPYHLMDVPMVGTYINAYTSNDHVVRAVVEKLTGRSPFTGVSPVDAEAGLQDVERRHPR